MQKKHALIVIMCLALLVAYLTGSVATATGPKQEGGIEFKTPEEAIAGYVEGLAQADFQKILQASAINEMSANFKFDLYIDRLKAFLPFSAMGPSNYPLFVETNRAQLTAQLANQVKMFVYALLSTEDVSEGKMIKMELEQANRFITEVDTARLAGLKFEKTDTPRKDIMNSARNVENMTKSARMYGADEMTERVTLFTFEGNYYFMGFGLLRYGESWKISSQASILAGLSAYGTPMKTTPEAFEQLVSGS